MISKSKSQTQKLAEKLASSVRRQVSRKTFRTPNIKHQTATVIALCGELGAGKTTFIQGFMKGLGIKQRITSPTFIIFRRHEISGTSVYHFDLYRIKTAKEIISLGFKKILKDPNNIILIEWPESVKKLLPKNTIWVCLEHGKNINQRHVIIK